MRHSIIIGMIFLLSSCASSTNRYSETMQSWHGVKAQKLISQWGRPDQMSTGRNGNTVLIYNTSSYRAGFPPTSPLVGVNASNPDRPAVVSHTSILGGGGRSMTLDCVAMFEVNKNKTIIGTQFQGSGCYGSDNFADRRANHQS